jgi:hypothetical protein
VRRHGFWRRAKTGRASTPSNGHSLPLTSSRAKSVWILIRAAGTASTTSAAPHKLMLRRAMSIRPPSPAAAASAVGVAAAATTSCSSDPSEPLPTTASVPLSPSGKRIYPRGQNPGLRYAEPYYYPYKTYAKGRWLGRELVRRGPSAPFFERSSVAVADILVCCLRHVSLARGRQHRVPGPVSQQQRMPFVKLAITSPQAAFADPGLLRRLPVAPAPSNTMCVRHFRPKAIARIEALADEAVAHLTASVTLSRPALRRSMARSRRRRQSSGRATPSSAKTRPVLLRAPTGSKLTRFVPPLRNTVHRHEPPISIHPIQIIHEDPTGRYIVIDKPGGMPVHPTGRFTKHTVTETLMSPDFGYKKIHSAFPLLLVGRSGCGLTNPARSNRSRSR